MSNERNVERGAPGQEYSDEISLVDITATFIRRRRIFYVVFIVVTLAGLAYALLATERYEYVSLIQVAQKNSSDFVRPPATTIATLENRWLPEVQTVYRAKHDRKLPFDVSFSNPENTGLIRYSSNAAKAESQAVESAHTELIKNVKDSQGQLIAHERRSLKMQITSLESALETLKGLDDAGEAIAGAIEKRSRLEGKLEELQEVEVLVTSRESVGKTGPKRSLIVVLAILLGGMMGVFFAFMSEFVVNVKEQLATADAE